MSGAREVASKAEFKIEELIAEMLDHGYINNDVALGCLLSSEGDIQVQLKITRDPNEFLIDYDE